MYAVIFADAINVKIRRARSPTGPIYLALGVTVDAERDILGLWAGEHGEGAKFWLRVLGRDQQPGRAGRVPAGLRRPRGPARCGERGLGDDDRANLHCPFAQEFVQICLKKGLGRGRQRLKPVYTAASGGRRAGPVRRVLRRVGETLPSDHPALGGPVGGIRALPAVRRSGRSSAPPTRSSRSAPGCTPAVRARGHFPTEQAALTCLYLAIMRLDPTGRGRQRWTNQEKAALNAFDIAFDGSLTAGRK